MVKNILIVFFLVIFAFFSCTQGEKKIKIGYVQITEDEVLDAAKKALFQTLVDSGFVDGVNVKLIDNNAQGDLSMISTILQSFQSQGVDLVITNSTPCMVAAAQMIKEIPVVFTVSFAPYQLGMKTAPSNLYGIYDPLHSDEIIEMMRECLPNIKQIGLPYNNGEPNAELAAKAFTSGYEKLGIKVLKATVNSPNDIPMVGQYLANQKIDALLVAGDNTVYRGLNLLGRIADESHIPLFVTDALQVEKGAAVGLGINYEKWGHLSGLKAVDILKGRSITNKIEPLSGLELIINTKACEKQGLVVPQSLLHKATLVF